MNFISKQIKHFEHFAPFFVEYHFYADNHGASCAVVSPDENFLPDMEQFKKSINEKTRGVLINSPNNPTGVLYGSDTLTEIASIIRSKEDEFGTEIYLISDEPYRKLIFDGYDYPHIFQYHPRSIVATSHSKDLALPGERIGFIAVNPACDGVGELIDGLVFCTRTLGFVNAPALAQQIVTVLQDVTVDVDIYQRKRDLLYGALSEIGYSIVKPQGAFYLFPQSPISDDVQFVDELKKHRVLAVPGRGFGLPGYFRLSYCLEDSTLKGAIPGLRAAFDKYR